MPWYNYQCFWGDGEQITETSQIANGATLPDKIAATRLNLGEGASTMCLTYGVDPLTDPLDSGETRVGHFATA